VLNAATLSLDPQVVSTRGNAASGGDGQGRRFGAGAAYRDAGWAEGDAGGRRGAVLLFQG